MKQRRTKRFVPARVDPLEPRLLLTTAAPLLASQSAPPPEFIWNPPVLVDSQFVFPNSGDDQTSEVIFNLTTGQWSAVSLGHMVGAASAVVGDTVLFAGGAYTGTTANPTSVGSTQVDIYDASTGQWSTAQLSSPRIGITTVNDGNKVFFAGGEANQGSYVGSAPPQSTVDIYDDATRRWSTAALSQARYSPAAVAVDGQAIFAGGSILVNASGNYLEVPSDTVDIYDNATGQWSTARLSGPMDQISTAVVGDQAIFISDSPPQGDAGAGDLVNIYDAANGTWSTTDVPELLGTLGVAVVDDELVCIGGYVGEGAHSVNSTTAEIYNVLTGTWSTSTMPEAIALPHSATIGDDVLFIGAANIADIGYSAEMFDAATNQWSIVGLPHPYKVYNDFNYDVPTLGTFAGRFFLSEPAGGLLPLLEYQSVSSQAPVNQSQLSGTTVDITPKVFRWSPTTSATSYGIYYDKQLVATVADNRWTPDSSVKLTGSHIWYVAANLPGGVIAGLPSTFSLLNPVVNAELVSWSFPDTVNVGTKGHAQLTLTINNIPDLPSSIIVGVSLSDGNGYQNGNVLLGSTKVSLDAATESKTIEVSIPITAPSGLYSTFRYFPLLTVRIGRKLVIDYPASGPAYLIVKPKRSIPFDPLLPKGVE